MFEFFKQFISMRGVQLAARYIGMALVWAAGALHVQTSAGDTSTTATTLGTLFCALILFAVDHWLHKPQTSGSDSGKSFLPMILVALLLSVAGCSMSAATKKDITDIIVAAIETAISQVLVKYDPATDKVIVTFNTKTSAGWVVENVMTEDEVQAARDECTDPALKARYQAALDAAARIKPTARRRAFQQQTEKTEHKCINGVCH